MLTMNSTAKIQPQRREENTEKDTRRVALCSSRLRGFSVSETAKIQPQRRQENTEKDTRRVALCSSRLCGLSVSESNRPRGQDYPTEPLFQPDRVKVDQQPELPPSQTKLAQERRFMDGLKGRHRPRDHDHASTDQQPDLIGHRQHCALVRQGKGALALKWHAPQQEFVAQACLITRWQQPWSQLRVNLSCSRDNFPGQSLSLRIATIRSGKKKRAAFIGPGSSSAVVCAHRSDLVSQRSEDKPFNSFLKNCNIEVEQEGYLPSPQFHISEHLRSMDRYHSLSGFRFDNHGVCDKHIESVTALQLYAFVNHRHGLLGLVGDASCREFLREGALVSHFELSRPEFAVYFDRGADDLMRQFIGVHGGEATQWLTPRKEIRSHNVFLCAHRASAVESPADLLIAPLMK